MITHSDIFSAPASVRWKRNSISVSGNTFSLANARRIRQMVSSQNASKFLNNTEILVDETVKVSKGEEIKEVSSQLSFLRKHHDIKKTINEIRSRNYTAKSFDLKMIEINSTRATTKLKNSREIVLKLQRDISEVKKDREEKIFDTYVYNQIIERMNLTKIHLDMRNLILIKSLKSNHNILVQETEKKRTVRENRIQTSFAVKNLEKFITRETKEKCEVLQILEKDVRKKKETNKNREKRMKRQLEILEAAADEDRYMSAIQLREGLLLHVLWYIFLQKKLLNDMRNFYRLETAFENVKKTFGIDKTDEIIKKLLTSEASYSEILENVTYTKNKINEYNNKNQEIEERLKLLNMIKGESINPAKDAELKLKIKRRDIETDKEKLRRVRASYTNVKVWCNKISDQISQSSDEFFTTQLIQNENQISLDSNLLSHISNLKLKVKSLLDQYKKVKFI